MPWSLFLCLKMFMDMAKERTVKHYSGQLHED